MSWLTGAAPDSSEVENHVSRSQNNTSKAIYKLYFLLQSVMEAEE